MTHPCPPEPKQRQPRSQNSDIRGIGYGDWHAWENFDTAWVGSAPPEFKWTRYDCRVCGASFKHYYDMEPNIFVAMRTVPVPDQCARKTRNGPAECLLNSVSGNVQLAPNDGTAAADTPAKKQ